MNIEALTQDINVALEKHGIAGAIQDTLAGLITLATTPGGRTLIQRGLAGATLFAVDDDGSVAFSGTRTPPINGVLLNQLLASIPPDKLRGLLASVNDEISAVKAECTCSKCIARRAEGAASVVPSESTRSTH